MVYVYAASKFRGVKSDDGGKTWRVQIGHAGTKLMGGSYASELLAAKASDRRALCRSPVNSARAQFHSHAVHHAPSLCHG
jgi:hypothetical protein